MIKKQNGQKANVPFFRRMTVEELSKKLDARREIMSPSGAKQKLRIIPLGGNEEVGRNMTVFEYGNDIIILDMGLQFPEEDMPGIDYIIPNTAYLRGKEKRIRAVLFSHGHLDHIGAAPILLQQLGYPLVVGRPLTIALIKNRLEDFSRGAIARCNSAGNCRLSTTASASCANPTAAGWPAAEITVSFVTAAPTDCDQRDFPEPSSA